MSEQNPRWRARPWGWALLALLLLVPGVAQQAQADGGVTFNDASAALGLTGYQQTPPAREALREAAMLSLPVETNYFFNEFRPTTPMKSRGTPGISVFDYDRDGDWDMFVTNGPGTPKSLFKNQLKEAGTLSFIDVAAAAGLEMTDMEASGTCNGDIDNDGDPDLYVVSTGHPNRLFRNNGNGTFTNITASAGVAGQSRHGVGCSFGDIDNDGRLDLVVANMYHTMDTRLAVLVAGPTWPMLQHNNLFRNLGGNTFQDVSASSGIENVSNMSGPGLSGAAMTWAIAMVDIDQDGDTDILSADNQGGGPADRSEERGWNRLYRNNGHGQFTDVTEAVGLDFWGSWMGLSFGDANCDGNLDFFVTNIGDYLTAPGRHNWVFEQHDDGTFTNTRPSEANPFGWGTVMLDYDNDADSDFIYYGGIDLLQISAAENPGVLLNNNGICSGDWTYALEAIPHDHRLRSVDGVAAADFNNDGFFDLATVSSYNIVPDGAFLPMTIFSGPQNSIFDSVARFQLHTTTLTVPGMMSLRFPRPSLPNGNLMVELNSAGNGNSWMKVQPIGGIGKARDGRVNRDGVGAILKFSPAGFPTSIQPILGGSSFASQNALEVGFGMNDAPAGILEVLWPGGVRNRLYDVLPGERIRFPEIPCSFDGDWEKPSRYFNCVNHNLNDMRQAGLITNAERHRFRDSAAIAFLDAQGASAGQQLSHAVAASILRDAKLGQTDINRVLDLFAKR